ETLNWVRFAILTLAVALPRLWAGAPESSDVEGVINAPVDQVWTALTTTEGIESWMVAKTQFELRVGALWRTSYSKDSDLNDDQSIHHLILAFDPGRMLAFRTVKPPKGFPFPNALANAWTVIYLDPAGPDRTKFRCRMLGFTGDEESQKMRVFFDRGNRS